MSIYFEDEFDFKLDDLVSLEFRFEYDKDDYKVKEPWLVYAETSDGRPLTERELDSINTREVEWLYKVSNDVD